MKPFKPTQPHKANEMVDATHPPGSRRILHTFAILLPALVVSSGFAADLPIYTDSLLNGWQNWSWATVNLSAGAPVHSGTASISVSSTNFQALYLHHSALNGSQYSSMDLWIDGGSTGGQPVQAQATRNGVAGPAVMLAPLPVDSWREVVIPLQALGVANATDFDGFWLQVQSLGLEPTFFVDDIRLTAVPEPSVGALAAMIGACCGIWVAGRGRVRHRRTRRGSAG
jgi:hypothetical protein